MLGFDDSEAKRIVVGKSCWIKTNIAQQKLVRIKGKKHLSSSICQDVEWQSDDVTFCFGNFRGQVTSQNLQVKI